MISLSNIQNISFVDIDTDVTNIDNILYIDMYIIKIPTPLAKVQGGG